MLILSVYMSVVSHSVFNVRSLQSDAAGDKPKANKNQIDDQ